MGARKLKNGAGDGADIHVFNIKPCVFPAKFRTPSCQTARRPCRLGTKPLAYRVFLFPTPTSRDETMNTITYTRAVLGHVARGCPGGGMVTARIEPCIMSNITVITLNKFGKRARGCCVYVFLVITIMLVHFKNNM